MTPRRSVVAAFLLVAGIVASSAAPQQNASKLAPLAIQEQGSFAVGGTVVTTPGTFDPIAQGAYNPAGADPRGQTLHGDHAYVFYQVPVNARRVPLVFWHGHGQSAKTWETTPDGREGFQTIFLRRAISGVPDRSATTRPRGPQHAAGHHSGHARRAALVRYLPAGRLARPLSGRAVLARPRGARPVLPADGPEHGAVRRGGEHEGGGRAVRQDRTRRARHALAERQGSGGARR